jgi:RNA polymerase sigma factor (sigma-70 family)
MVSVFSPQKKFAPSPLGRRPLVDMKTGTRPLEVLAARSSEYERYVQRHFFRRLAPDDCADAVQDAFLEAQTSETCASLELPSLDAWLRRAAYKKAIDILRGPDRDGRGAVRRQRTDIDTLAEVLAADESPDENDDDAAAVRAAFERLPPVDQRVIGLRHHDNLPREACAELLGMSVTRFKRAHTRAAQRLISMVIETRPYDSCSEARALINLSADGLLDDASAARRDAHVAGCPHCHQYQRRSRGLLAFLPIPALGIPDRLFARLHGLIDRIVPATSLADTATATGGAGALGAGGVKLAALVTSGAVAVGGGTVAVNHAPDSRSHKPSATAAAPTARTVQPFTVGALGSFDRPAALKNAAVVSSSRPLHRSNSSKRSSPTSSASAATGELKPVGHEVTTTAATTLESPTSAPAATTASTPTHQQAPASAPVPAPPPADSSSGEFAPHP